MADKRPALRPLPRARLYEQLVARLLDYVEQEGLKPGDRLPPERVVATWLGVSRASVAQALVALEVQGVVDVRHGEGAVLLDRSHGHRRGRGQRRALLTDVVDARQALEVRLAELAALRRDEEDLAAIDRALVTMTEELARGERGLTGDEQFHAAVTAAAHSGLLGELMDSIADAIRQSRVESLAQPGRPDDSLADHAAIAAAVRSGDPAAAAAAMRAHIERVGDVAVLRD